ncbi:MAG: alpha/beta hydrolase [Pseudolabrys sp.]|nr:alpha/beta hydrolase [Pseudolabrys sp.]MBV9955709.1 alpha/beta hydrolase [Pseudolabrys sp.]
MIVVLVVTATLAALAVVTAIGVVLIERAHPPQGQMVEVDGGRLHVVTLGSADAQPVVLLHGASGNLLDMRLALGERLARDYRVILIDRPGHGWSDRPGGRADSSPARQAALIHQALERLGVKRPVMVGHSWAGALVPAYALAYPDDVKALVLLAPVTHPWRGGVGWFNHVAAVPVLGPLLARTMVLPIGHFLVGPIVRIVFDPQTPPPGYAQRTGAELALRPSEFLANVEDLIDLKANVSAQSARYGEIAVPVAIISGDHNDKIVYTDIHSRATASQVKNGKLTVLPGVGHMVNHVAADLVIQTIDELARNAR